MSRFQWILSSMLSISASWGGLWVFMWFNGLSVDVLLVLDWFFRLKSQQQQPVTARTNQQQSEVQRESEAWGEPTSGWHSVPPCTSWPVDPSSRLWGSCCNGCSPICNETLPHLSESSHSCNPHWRNEVPRAAGQHIITHSQQLTWQVMTDQL